MAKNNRGGSRGSNRGRSGRNRKPEDDGYSGMMSTVRGKPLRTAAAVGGAVAAGLFLWSRRNLISDEISGWREGMRSDSDFAAEDSTSGESPTGTSGFRASKGGRSQAEIAEEALTLKEIGKTT